MSRTRLFSLAFAALATLVAGIAAAGEVVLYSSNSVDAINAVTEEFNKKYPDIKISAVRGSTGATMQRIKAEAGAPKADIFWSGGFSVLRLYKDYFDPYQSPETAALNPVPAGPDLPSRRGAAGRIGRFGSMRMSSRENPSRGGREHRSPELSAD